MSTQKIPVFGTFWESQPFVAGLVGYDALTPFAYHAPVGPEVTISRFKLALSAATNIVVVAGVATVTNAAHLNTIVGQQVTFSGITGALAAMNGQTYTITKITSTSVYSFACAVPDGTSGGAPVQEPVFTLPAGRNIVRADANIVVEYNSDNLYNSIAGQPTTAPVWKTYLVGNATPVIGGIFSDGWVARIRCSGTTANSFFSHVG